MQKIIVNIAWEMRSVLQPEIWNLRLIYALGGLGGTTGWAYQQEWCQMRMSEFSEYLFKLFLEIKKD